MSRTRHVNCIIPPHLLDKLLGSDDHGVRQAALDTLLTTARLRGERGVRASFVGAASAGNGRRTVFDCQQGRSLPFATLAQSEDGAASADVSVTRAFDGLGITRDFYSSVLQRNSLDDRGMRLDAYVHFDVKYNNAFWDGRQMVFGDGDGSTFTDFTGSLDVIGHELTHAVTEFTAGLAYHNQSGALNESMSDVFGSLVKQWSMKQSAETADWLIGTEVFTPGIDADALRSMKAPGHAYDNELFGKDPQPDHMRDFVHLPDTERGDLGGVHINSGIPNKAFYLTATNIGGFAWEAPGLIWYESLKASSVDTQFQDFADTTYQKAEELYGADSAEQSGVLAAWQEVGIQITGVPAGVARSRSRSAGRDGASSQNGGVGREDGLAALSRQVEALSAQVTGLSSAVTALQRERVTHG
ncbi:M4 family metallopeptidase [Streptomyces turgidiscabies]|uniref:Neutral metalloproteinase n=1 Tax=Streptomyces turgidiscabies (strain Car8) TaxID=698760 RepID=L7F2U1_STRT8|nr:MULTISPECIES: M4 family metallopeptidase [Streptomyces]ELP65459.1 thermolysin metallopeptidase, alpha-helical domain protein [Streptomyces turgidiscabies Car8]MDX3492289.1 M4 family metallopeptidase [Streptomyces turgidiscabies]GAQ69419.1 protease PrtS precursor [Streptomyces turgidiscabies]